MIVKHPVGESDAMKAFLSASASYVRASGIRIGCVLESMTDDPERSTKYVYGNIAGRARVYLAALPPVERAVISTVLMRKEGKAYLPCWRLLYLPNEGFIHEFAMILTRPGLRRRSADRIRIGKRLRALLPVSDWYEDKQFGLFLRRETVTPLFESIATELFGEERF